MRALWLGLLLGCDGTTIANGPHTLYQVTGEHMPTRSAEAISGGLDLNGDGAVDNQLGTDIAVIFSRHLADPQAATDLAIMNGQLQLTVDVENDKADPTLVNVTSFAMPGQDVAAPAVIDNPLSGSLNGDLIEVGPGELPLVIAPFGIPIVLPLEDGYVQAHTDGDSLHAIMGGTFDVAIVHEQLIPQWAATLGPIITRDCTGAPPTCGCATGSPGETVIQYLDTTHDCAITADELENNSLVQSLAQPDFPRSGTPTRMSVGVALDATRVPDR